MHLYLAKDFMDKIIAQCNISKSEYRNLYALFVFDVGKQESEKLKSAMVDLTVFANFRTSIPANTNAFAVVIPDKTIKLYSVGRNFNVI